MENSNDHNKKLEFKESRSQLFYAEDSKEEVNKNKLDAIADFQEDLEAIVQDGHVVDANEATYQNLRGKKNNSLVNGDYGTNISRAEIGDMERLEYENENDKEEKPKTDRKYNDQRGGSGMPFDAGNLDSPNSQTNLKHK